MMIFRLSLLNDFPLDLNNELHSSGDYKKKQKNTEFVEQFIDNISEDYLIDNYYNSSYFKSNILFNFSFSFYNS